MNSKRGMIPPYALFFVLFVSRLVVTLTFVQGVSVGKFGSDILISIAISVGFVILFTLPISYCVKKGVSPMKTPAVSWFYSAYFVFFAALNISRFSYFDFSRMNMQAPMSVMIVILSIAMCYGAYLGIESIGRFGFICGVLLVITLVAIFALNAREIEAINYYPIMVNSRAKVWINALLFSCNSVEPAILLCVADRVNGDAIKPFYLSIGVSYLSIFLLVMLCIGVMGTSADLHSYPIFSLFQLASIGGFSRLDMLHTAFWILAVLMKCSLLIYCASQSFGTKTAGKRVVVFSLVSAGVAILINEVVGLGILSPSKVISVALFAVAVIALPIVFLIKGRLSEQA